MATIACMRVSPQPRHQVRPRTTGIDGRAPRGTRQHETAAPPEDGEPANRPNDRRAKRALAIVKAHDLIPRAGGVEAVCVMLVAAGAESSR